MAVYGRMTSYFLFESVDLNVGQQPLPLAKKIEVPGADDDSIFGISAINSNSFLFKAKKHPEYF